MRYALCALSASLLSVAAAAEPSGPVAAALDAQAVKLTAERCEARTGSRVRPPTGSDCRALYPEIRSYSNEELEQTLEPDVADALRRIDPRFGP